MFTVKSLNQNSPKSVPLCSGITFGFIDKPIFFEVTTPSIVQPLIIEFLVVINPSQKDTNFSIAPVQNAQRKVVFTLPQRGMNGGLARPVGLATVQNEVLGFMFSVSTNVGIDSYKIEFEFYNGKTDA